MNIKPHHKLKSGLLVLPLLVVAGGSFFATSTGCEQPAPKCASSRGDFIVRYTYVSGADSCKELVGEKVGVQTYNAVGEEQKPDLDRGSVAIQADGLGTLRDNGEAAGVTDPDPNAKAFSLGSFTTKTPVGQICSLGPMTPAQQALGEIPGEDGGPPGQPPTSLTYTWSNVRFLVTAQYYGSQFAADVAIKRNGAECAYRAQALYPYVDCTKLDDAGEPVKDADGKLQPDDSFCAAEANPPAHPTGSGINPDFAVHCDPVLLACVPNSTTFPAFR